MNKTKNLNVILYFSFSFIVYIKTPFIYLTLLYFFVVDSNLDHSCQDLQPCGNMGWCRQYPTYHECVCPDGYTGVNCERGMFNVGG